MNLLQITSSDLDKIIKLLEQKEALQARVAQIDAELTAFETGGAPPRAPGHSAPKASARARVKRAARGTVKAAIIELIKNAGKPGITVKDIAAKLGVNYNRVFTWFYNTGNSIPEVRKVAPGTYGWASPTPAPAKPAVAPAPVKPSAPKAAPAPKASKPAKAKAKAKAKAQGKAKQPAVGKDTVIGLIKAAGEAGVTVKEIAGKLGVDLQAVYRWFNATGKKVKEIKKVAPATYRWVG